MGHVILAGQQQLQQVRQQLMLQAPQIASAYHTISGGPPTSFHQQYSSNYGSGNVMSFGSEAPEYQRSMGGNRSLGSDSQTFFPHQIPQ